MPMGMSLQIPPTQCMVSPNMYIRGQRIRQNSVFVGQYDPSAQSARKSKSAVDIHSLVLNEVPEPV